LSTNHSMMKVFEKGGVVNAKLEYGVYNLTMPFDPSDQPDENFD